MCRWRILPERWHCWGECDPGICAQGRQPSERLLRSRDDIFDQYSLQGCIDAFDALFELREQISVSGSQRTMLLFKRRQALEA